MIPRATRHRMDLVARHVRERAERMLWDGRQGTFDGLPIPDLEWMYRSTYDIEEVGTRLMFTRDTNHHESGWIKNPDYERCYHLSLSAAGPGPSRSLVVPVRLEPLVGLPIAQPELDSDLEEAWVDAFFGEDKRYAWRESAKSRVGRDKAVWHYRVFCDEHWQPLVPRGEVYSLEFTERGWKIWSELHAEGHGPIVESTVDPT